MIERQTRNLFLPQCCSRRSFCSVSETSCLVLCRRGGCCRGLEICCGAWAVHHPLLCHPTITLSHLSILPGWAESLAGTAALSPGDLEEYSRDVKASGERCFYGGASSTVPRTSRNPISKCLSHLSRANGQWHAIRIISIWSCPGHTSKERRTIERRLP
jgi:hypothetical protein